MPGMTTLKDRITETARRQQQDYASGEDRPLRGYVTVMSMYGGLVGGMAVLVTTGLAAEAGSGFLQFAYAAVEQAAGG